MEFSSYGPALRVALDPRNKELKPVLSSHWEKSKERTLVILERPDPVDVESKCLMSPNKGTGRDTEVNATTNSINGVLSFALSENREAENSHSFGVALFSSDTWPSVLRELKPTKVLMSGFRCGSFLFPEDEYLRFKQGNPIAKDGVLYCQTLPIDQLLYKENDKDADTARSDLLYMVSRALSNLIKGRNPESLGGLKAKPVVVDTMAKFDKLMGMLAAAEEFSLDIETSNLSTHHNKVLTCQFSMSEAKGYLIPLQHPNSPFTEKEHKYLRAKLKELMSGSGKLIYVFNGKFDQRVLRRYLRLPVINHDFWEVQAGEHSLDENIGSLDSFSFRGLGGESIKTKFGNLRNMLCLYGNDAYYCVAKGQVVRMSDNSTKTIENIVPGDLVASYNHTLQTIVPSLVTLSSKTPVRKRLVRINHKKGTLVVTEDHLVWSEDRKSYVEARTLLKGERLIVN